MVPPSTHPGLASIPQNWTTQYMWKKQACSISKQNRTPELSQACEGIKILQVYILNSSFNEQSFQGLDY